MKAYIILINFALSLIGLTVSANNIIIPIIGALWFFSSCWLLIRADKKGTMDKVKDLLKFDEL